MEKYEYLIIIILVLLSILINIFYRNSQKIYFFFDSKDEKSVELLNNILKNSKNEIIIVTSEEKGKMKEILQNLNSERSVSKVINIEKLTDLSEIIYETCFKNAKCVFQPHDRFYAIANRLNVQGYPFQFDNNIKTPSNIEGDMDGNEKLDSSNVKKLKELINNPVGCSNTRSSRGL